MGALLNKHNHTYGFTGIAKLSFVTLMMALSAASVGAIWALYLKSFVGSESMVGLLSSLFAFVGFLFYFLTVPIVEKYSKSGLFIFSLILSAVFYFLFAFIEGLGLLILAVFGINFVLALRTTTFGIIIRDSSRDKQLSRNEGLVYTFLNFGWVIGPLIAGFVVANYGLNSVFFLGAGFAFLGLFAFLFSGIRDVNIAKKIDKDVLKNFGSFFKNKDRVNAYILRGAVGFWWVLIYLYAPLFIVGEGLGAEWIGWFLFAVPLPLIFFDYFFAQLAGKVGFKKLFGFGFLSVSLIAIFAFFVDNVFGVLGLLVLAGVGMAMLEPTTEAYFFKVTNKKEENKYYGPFNTSLSVFGFFGRLLPSLILLYLPFRFVFLLYGVCMGLMIFVVRRVREVA
jgi:MFS family permease